jgi:hypothetical protein
VIYDVYNRPPPSPSSPSLGQPSRTLFPQDTSTLKRLACTNTTDAMPSFSIHFSLKPSSLHFLRRLKRPPHGKWRR